MRFGPAADLRFFVRARGLPVGGVRVDREAFRQGDRGAADLGGRGNVRAGLLGNLEVDVEARGSVRRGPGRLRVEARVETELVAAGGRRIRVAGVGHAFVVSG